jgi:TNF receptor-associated factor 4
VKEIIDLRKSKDFLKMKVEGLERDNQKRIKMHTEFLALKEKFEKFQNEVESQVGDLQDNILKLQTNLKSSQSSVADLLKSQAITKQNVEEILEKRYSEHSSLIKFSEFEKSRKDNVNWYSPGFYSSPAGGYKMCLNVIPNGYGDSEGTHVSCFIYLMRGDNDDSLEWPFQATVKIELLNQLKDQNHHGVVLTFDNSTSQDFKSRVIEQERSENGLGIKKFFELSSLKDFGYMYLNDDTLYFRVSVQSCCKFKDWLV